MLHPCSNKSRIKKLKEKEKKKKIENRNDLDVLSSHDISSLMLWGCRLKYAGSQVMGLLGIVPYVAWYTAT